MHVPLRTALAWLGLYAVVAIAYAWPLPLHLDTHLTGAPSGDTGVYVWNQWVFHHEVEQHRLPFTTSTILSLSRPVDLTLHNYTFFMNVLAYPFIETFGLIRTFNLVYLAMMVLTAWCTAWLAHVRCGRTWESWLAGLAFAFSPVLMARSTAHFSLVAAAPLPVLLLALIRAEQRGRVRDAAAVGAVLAWAAFCDIYYAVYGTLLILAHVGASAVAISRNPNVGWLSFGRRVTGRLIVVAATFVTAIALQGGLIEVAGIHISMRSLYTPMLVLTLLALAYGLLTWAPRVEWRYRFAFSHTWPAVAMAATAAVLLSPVLIAYGERMLEGRSVSPAIYWRSSPPGVDLLAFVMPNPTSPWFGGPFKAWIEAQRVDGFAELTGALPWVALIAIGVALWTGWRPRRRRWIVAPVLFALMALGPFVHIAGINTYVPGPWAFLRYVPVIGLARSPSRFVVLVALLVAVLFALALTAMGERWPHRRRLMLGLVTVLLLIELSPAPRPLFAATVPEVFHRIAADPRPDIRVVSLPFGLRDGTSSIGNFSPLTQYQQTVHGKRLVGGYVSRVTAEQREGVLRYPVLHALIALSEPNNAGLTAEERDAAMTSVARFVERAQVAYVITDDSLTSPALRAFAEELFALERIGASDGYTLYRPHVPLPTAP